MEIQNAYINFIQNLYLPEAGRLENLREPFRTVFKQGAHIDYQLNAFIKNWGQLRFDKNLFEGILELPMKSFTGVSSLSYVRKFIWSQYRFIPSIVDVRKKIVISKDDSYKRSSLSKGNVSRLIKLHLHIYKHGAVSIILNISLHFDPPVTTKSLIKVINELRPRTRQGSHISKTRTPSINIKISQHLLGTSTELFERIVKDTITSLVYNPTYASVVPPESYTIVHSPDFKTNVNNDITLSKELYGLLKLDPHFSRFNSRYVSNCSSVFGKYKTDIIIPNTKVMIIGLPRTYNVYDFHWHLVTLAEFVLMQRQLFDVYTKNLRRSRTQILKAGYKPKERMKNFFKLTTINFDTLDFLEELLYFHTDFSPQYRKWYYILTEKLGVNRRKDELLHELDSYISEGKEWQPPLNDVLNLLTSVKGLLG